MKKGELTSEDLVSACKKYFDQHKNKLYAFDDLRRILDSSKEDMAETLSYMLENQGQDNTVSAFLPNLRDIFGHSPFARLLFLGSMSLRWITV